MPEKVKCGDCAHFIPANQYNACKVGKCAELENYRLKKPSIKQIESAFIKLGGICFKPDLMRDCSKFKNC